MVVVVQSFSEGYERQQLEVGRVVFEALVSEGMARAVDSGVEEQVDGRERCEGREAWTDAHEEGQDHTGQRETQYSASQEDPIQAVEGEVGGVLLQRIVVVRLAAVVVDVADHDPPVSLDVRAVRISLDIAEVVVLAVDGNPLA